MGEVVVAFKILGSSCDSNNIENNKESVEKGLSEIKTREDAEKFFQSLNGEVKFVKESELVKTNEGNVLYSSNYLNATLDVLFC